MYKRVQIVCLSFSLTTALAFGQCVFSSGRVVPILDDDVSIRVPVKVFDRTNFFLVDTGTSGTALDIRFRGRLGELVRQFDKHDFYRSPEILLAEVTLGLKEVFCADLGLYTLITGEPCDGILGMDLLKDPVVDLDFDRSLLSISRNLPEQIKKNAAG